MYEQTESSPWRRIVAISLAALVAVALLWVLMWLMFFRRDTPNKVAVPRHATTQQQTGTSTTGAATTTPATTPTPNNSGASTTPSTSVPSATTQPGHLANTGAGNVVLPVVIASAAGIVLYQVRLRKHVQ